MDDSDSSAKATFEQQKSQGLLQFDSDDTTLRSETRPRLAVLIDGENISPRCAADLFGLIDPLGEPVVRRVFGDWNRSIAKGWKEALLEYCLEPIQQFSYATGRNATDMALVIAAMDLFHGRQVDGFCLASGDCDFIPLVSRLRLAQVPVFGFGPETAAATLRTACTRYFLLSSASKKQIVPPKKSVDADIVNLLIEAVNQRADETGWANLSMVGSQLSKMVVGYSVKKWGFASLGKMLDAAGHFEVVRSTKAESRVRIKYLTLPARESDGLRRAFDATG